MAEHDEHSEHESAGSGHGHGGGGHGHGGGGHEEHEGAPEWLISFADNVALMMGFFVILLAMNMAPKGKDTGGGDDPDAQHAQARNEAMLDLVISLREAFHNPVDLNSSDPGDALLVKRIIARTRESEARDEGRVGREHDVKSVRPGDYFVRGARIPFEHGSSELSEAARSALAEILPVLKGHSHILEIRGHTSSAEAFKRPDRGMELSFQRALAVANALSEAGIPWSQLRVMGCADGDRLERRAYSEADHRANQRAEITVTRDGVPDYDGPGAPDAGASDQDWDGYSI